MLFLTFYCDSYAIGGLSGGEDKDSFWRVVAQCTAALPEDKPRYVMVLLLNHIKYFSLSYISSPICMCTEKEEQLGTLSNFHSPDPICNYSIFFTDLDLFFPFYLFMFVYTNTSNTHSYACSFCASDALYFSVLGVNICYCIHTYIRLPSCDYVSIHFAE